MEFGFFFFICVHVQVYNVVYVIQLLVPSVDRTKFVKYFTSGK